jgi:hypothetical protein
VPRFSPIRILTRGFGGPASAIMLRAFLNFDETIEEIRQNVLGRSRNKDSITFYDDVVVHKISAMLYEVNNSPLANPLYNRISRLVFEKKFKIKAALDENVSSKSEPLSILVSGYKVTREPDR